MTAKTITKLFRAIDGKRRGFFMVKRAETMSIRSTLFEFDMRLYDRNDINRTDKVLYGVRARLFGQNLFGRFGFKFTIDFRATAHMD